jgi:hypothetical protein
MAEIDPVQEILARLEKLQKELSFAAEAFQNGGAEQARPSVQIALGVIHAFLMTVFGAHDSKALMPLRQLIYARHDLDRGRVGPLLAPQKMSHRPRDSVAKEAFIAIPAACMELLVEGGVARKDAAIQIAHGLSAMGYRNGRDKPVTAQNVEDWRDRMRTGSSAENAAVGRFRRIVDNYRLTHPDRLTAANLILKRLPQIVAPEIPRKSAA